MFCLRWPRMLLVKGISPKSQPMRNKKNRENTRQRKQSHAQDNIYVVRQFTYVHGVARISLLSGKSIKCGYKYSHTQKIWQSDQIGSSYRIKQN